MKKRERMARKADLMGLVSEFIRYLLVGGSAFLVDFCILVLFNRVLLPESLPYRLYIATAIGFIAGLVFNYIFSILFVFRSAKNGNKGRSSAAFLIFSVIGVIGLGLTEFGMYLGVNVLYLNYMLAKIVVTCIVLLWNYLGRKILIFK
jgi:putative flippase GtrA